MSHEELLNQILANSCPESVQDGVAVFNIESHCVNWRITALRLGGGKYELIEAVSQPY